MSDDNERSVASAGSVVGDRDIIARLRDWRSVHLARLHEVMEQAADEIELLRGYRDEAEAEASIASLAVERLRLTDAEREAVAKAMEHIRHGSELGEPNRETAITLRLLLERTK